MFYLFASSAVITTRKGDFKNRKQYILNFFKNKEKRNKSIPKFEI